MRKFRMWLVFLAALLVATPLMGGVSQAENTYTLQYITSITGLNYLGYLQGISGINASFSGENTQVNVGFNNVDINGVYNRNVGIGNFRNQGSAAFINIEPNQNVLPVTFSAQSFSQGNNVTVGDFNYAVNLNISNFRSSGLLVLDVMAGSFCNQFTSLTFNMGKNASPPILGDISSYSLGNPWVINFSNGGVFSVLRGNVNAVTLTSQQMQAIAATQDNNIKVQGTQSAVATIQGAPNVQGVSAITLSAGVNNLVSHHVEVNIDTAR